jgi:hypothetical protein
MNAGKVVLLVVILKHPDDDAKKHGNCRHKISFKVIG